MLVTGATRRDHHGARPSSRVVEEGERGLHILVVAATLQEARREGSSLSDGCGDLRAGEGRQLRDRKSGLRCPMMLLPPPARAARAARIKGSWRIRQSLQSSRTQSEINLEPQPRFTRVGRAAREHRRTAQCRRLLLPHALRPLARGRHFHRVVGQQHSRNSGRKHQLWSQKGRSRRTPSFKRPNPNPIRLRSHPHIACSLRRRPACSSGSRACRGSAGKRTSSSGAGRT